MGYLPPVKLCPVSNPGLIHASEVSQESADMASKLMNDNHADYHIFTTTEEDRGVFMHNHLAHHCFTLYALGAKPQTLLSQYRRNIDYQREPMKRPDEKTSLSLLNSENYRKALGDESMYYDFVHFFEYIISEHGYEYLLQKYLLDGGENGNDMLPRMYMGYSHAIMHVGISLEFSQMPLMAEGFAQAAVHHDYWYTDFLQRAEDDAKSATESALSLSGCVTLANQDPKVRNCSNLELCGRLEGTKYVLREEMIRDGVCKHASKELGSIAARYRVDPNDLKRATAELINTSIWVAAGAQQPPHECRYDFFLIHGSNCSIWHSIFLEEPSLSNTQKARLLEYTGRVILMLYASQGAPHLNMAYVQSQKPRRPNDDWAELFARACIHEDDGHMCKLIRAIANAQQVSRLYDGNSEFKVKQHHFLPAAHAAIDSASARPMEGTNHYDFVRGSGFPDAWASVPVHVHARG